MEPSRRLTVKKLVLGLTALILFGCASQQSSPPRSEVQPPTEEPALPKAALPDLGPAPELTNDTWLNVASPLRLADLRGKVVMIDMWTFG
jgi:hypothetical protein